MAEVVLKEAVLVVVVGTLHTVDMLGPLLHLFICLGVIVPFN